MSRPRRVTEAAMKEIREEAIRRVENRTNKQLVRILAGIGVHLTSQYAGKLVALEIRKYREFHPHADDSRGT